MSSYPRVSKKLIIWTLGVVLLMICSIQNSQACSTILLNRPGQPVLAHNFDFMTEDALLVVNKRNVAKTASTLFFWGNTWEPMQWTSKFGSVTVNQYGREWPQGGINEAGLAVAQMMLPESQYAAPDNRPSIDVLQWIQYQLDTAATVAEVEQSDAQMRVTVIAPIHYLVCDTSGACAAVEFLNGQTVIHSTRQGNLPEYVLTNFPYEDSLATLKTYEGFGGTTPIPDQYYDHDNYNAWLNWQALPQEAKSKVAEPIQTDTRFERLAKLLKQDVWTTPAVEAVFEMLRQVAVDSTQWTLVYDLMARRVYLKTASNQQIRWFDLSRFDFSCETAVQTLDIKTGNGDISRQFVNYTDEQNLRLLQATYPPIGLAYFTESGASYPNSTTCQQCAPPVAFSQQDSRFTLTGGDDWFTGSAWSKPDDMLIDVNGDASGNFDFGAISGGYDFMLDVNEHMTADQLAHLDGRVAVLDETHPVPEPATLILISVGLLGLVGISRRKRRS